MKPVLTLGKWRHLDGTNGGGNLGLPAHHLVTHGVVVGMTGSGKTGFVTVLIEEAARAGVPTLVIDVKGDLPNLLLAFPDFDPARLEPWLEIDRDTMTPDAVASLLRERTEERRSALAEAGIGERELSAYAAGIDVRVLTPGGSAGEPLHMLSSLERGSDRWKSDPESARDALSAAVSLVLRLLGREPDPAKSREHVLLSVLAERRLAAGDSAELGALMQDVLEPPIAEIGALPVNAFMKKTERRALAAALNTLLASPTFAAWRRGTSLDIGDWLKKDQKTPIVIVSVAHLDDEERSLVLGVLLEEVLSWVRTLPGTQRLKALVVFDEVYGFLPPHPSNPPTKRPLVALMKQARAFGVGVVVATQNPMDLDYRTLSNAGVWCLGRLQTDADRARVLDGLALSSDSAAPGADDLGTTLQRLAPRWFVIRNAHASAHPVLVRPRHAMSYLRGPMTRLEIARARAKARTQTSTPSSLQARAR
jgi:DNA helicase HerA-like ATPase